MVSGRLGWTLCHDFIDPEVKLGSTATVGTEFSRQSWLLRMNYAKRDKRAQRLLLTMHNFAPVAIVIF